MPIANIDTPRPVARYKGSSAWMISELTSMHRLTSPSTTTPRGTPRHIMELTRAAVFLDDAFGRRRVFLELRGRPHRAAHELAAAVRADALEHVARARC